MSEAPVEPHPRRWAALVVISIAQLMVVLDATIVNIALPQAQRDLGITDVDRQWVVTAYTLTFGGLLLLGGRIADYWGRKRTFLVGAIGFAVASALGGAANGGSVLFAARALQGVFGALLAPAGLALMTVLFIEAKERAKAFGVFGAIAGGGSAVGLLLGGVLTEYANWRWCLLVNIPVALVALALAIPLVPESRAHGNTRYDVPGAVLATAGLVSVVYGFTKAATDGWSAPATMAFVAAGVVLLVAFVLVEIRSENPLLPMRILLDRNRGGAFLASVLTGAGLFGAFLFLIYYFQVVLGYTPLQAGVACLPITAGVLVAAGLATGLMPRIGPKPLMVAGSLTAASSMFYLTQVGVTSSYAVHVLPAALVLGFGLGLTFVPLSNLALIGVPDHDAGAASATLNATQQVGASLGTALLNTIYATAVTGYLATHAVAGSAGQLEGLVHGYTTAFAWGGGLLLASAVVIAVLLKVHREDLPAAELVAAPAG
ncbi:MAG TPA: MFS transporter [Mycobacteriales bacterium]|nr:MFS transporter [Mycobacteriales bacterium]